MVGSDVLARQVLVLCEILRFRPIAFSHPPGLTVAVSHVQYPIKHPKIVIFTTVVQKRVKKRVMIELVATRRSRLFTVQNWESHYVSPNTSAQSHPPMSKKKLAQFKTDRQVLGEVELVARSHCEAEPVSCRMCEFQGLFSKSVIVTLSDGTEANIASC